MQLTFLRHRDWRLFSAERQRHPWKCYHSRNNRTSDEWQMPHLSAHLVRWIIQVCSLPKRPNMIAEKSCFPQHRNRLLARDKKRLSNVRLPEEKCILEMSLWWRTPVQLSERKRQRTCRSTEFPFLSRRIIPIKTWIGSWTQYFASTITNALFIHPGIHPIDISPKNRRKNLWKWQMRVSNRLFFL